MDETQFQPKPDEPKKQKSSDSKTNLEGKMSKTFNRAQYPWLTERTTRIKDIFLYLHSEILDFVEYVTPNDEEIKVRKAVVQRIRNVVTETYPGAKVLVFGSCATGLNLPNSDIDLLVYYPPVREISMINRLTSELVKAGICASIEPIKHAKVPIIKL